MPAITLTDLSFSYTAEPLLDSVSFTVVNGERACLIGPNGCGKTTLLALVTGDLTPGRGSAEITGVEGGASGLWRAPDVLAMTGTVGDYLDAATAPVRALSTRFDETNFVLPIADDLQPPRRISLNTESKELSELRTYTSKPISASASTNTSPPTFKAKKRANAGDHDPGGAPVEANQLIHLLDELYVTCDHSSPLKNGLI